MHIQIMWNTPYN